eukprot:9490562-Pyramimonas_sp.AAC.2
MIAAVSGLARYVQRPSRAQRAAALFARASDCRALLSAPLRPAKSRSPMGRGGRARSRARPPTIARAGA